MLKQEKGEWKRKKKKRVGEEVGTTKMVCLLNHPPTKTPTQN
jgi:hypothetical protein